MKLLLTRPRLIPTKRLAVSDRSGLRATRSKSPFTQSCGPFTQKLSTFAQQPLDAIWRLLSFRTNHLQSNHMTKLYRLTILVFLLPALAWAQTNYVANTANASTPGFFNTVVGPSAGTNANMTGSYNTFLGNIAGANNTTGSDNTFLGSQAGVHNTTGSNNAFIGSGTGQTTTTGSNNVFVGVYAGYNNRTGSSNLFLGYGAGYANTTASNNSFVGYYAGSSTTTGGFNSFLGYQAGYANTTGNNNSFVGYQAGYANTTGIYNSFLGFSAGYANTTGNNNSFLGTDAGYSNTTGNDNTFVGNLAGLLNTTGAANTFMGSGAGVTNSSGIANVFIGSQAGYNNTTGTGNMFLGQQAGGNNTTANYNLFMGNGSGGATTTGSGNTAIGDGSGLHNTTGQRNVSIGQYAGLNNQTGTDNVFIGYGAKAGTVNPTNVTNSVAIGANAIVSQSNAIVLGNGANVGIGTSTPSAKLELASGVANTTGIKLTNLTYSYVPSVNASKFLTVDGSGNVILATYAAGARVGADESTIESLWERKGQFLQSTNGEAIIIGSGVSQTPAGYSLFVGQGLLAERVKVAVRNTSDWSDKVFDKSYPLKSLSAVEQYINTNKHLPGVPSAQEMVEKGNDLHQTDARLLEKIEELTLYVIEMKKDYQRQIDQLNRTQQRQLTPPRRKHR